jgi:hypothetical protein
MWKQQLQVLQIKPIYGMHRTSLKDLQSSFLNAIALQTQANLLYLLITDTLI